MRSSKFVLLNISWWNPRWLRMKLFLKLEKEQSSNGHEISKRQSSVKQLSCVWLWKNNRRIIWTVYQMRPGENSYLRLMGQVRNEIWIHTTVRMDLMCVEFHSILLEIYINVTGRSRSWSGDIRLRRGLVFRC